MTIKPPKAPFYVSARLSLKNPEQGPSDHWLPQDRPRFRASSPLISRPSLLTRNRRSCPFLSVDFGQSPVSPYLALPLCCFSLNRRTHGSSLSLLRRFMQWYVAIALLFRRLRVLIHLASRFLVWFRCGAADSESLGSRPLPVGKVCFLSIWMHVRSLLLFLWSIGGRNDA